jgi:hypothetical protein
MKNRMGTFYIWRRAANHLDRKKSVEVPQLPGAHLEITTKIRRLCAPVTELESSANPQPGKAALRSARFPACGFWRLSSRQLVRVSRCAQLPVDTAAEFTWIVLTSHAESH